MATKAYVPRRLASGPFTVDDAKRAGLERWHLESSRWRRIGPATYVLATVPDSPMQRLEAALRRLPPGSAFSGCTAAWLHGIDVAPCDPIEATVDARAGVSARAGMAVRRSLLAKGDVVNIQGLPVTSIERTLAELCDRLGLVESVVVLDMAMYLRRIGLDRLKSWVESRSGRRGIRGIRRAIGHAEPASESPMESRLRMVLVLGGLPRPVAQVEIRDRWGRVIGRPDLYYERARLGIEYDGATHRETLAQDNRRQNGLLNAGVRLLRFTAGDVMNNPAVVVSQVRAMLS